MYELAVTELFHFLKAERNGYIDFRLFVCHQITIEFSQSDSYGSSVQFVEFTISLN